MGAVGSPDALRPPLPPLNRYKRDVVLRLQSQDGGGGASRPATMPHAKSVMPVHTACIALTKSLQYTACLLSPSLCHARSGV